MKLVDLGNNGTFGRCSRGGAEIVGESAYVVKEWRDVCGVTGSGEETESEEEVIDVSSSTSSEPEDPAMAGIGGMLGGRLLGESHPNEPPTRGVDNLRSNHWLEPLRDALRPISEISSGVAGTGESVEDEEDEEA